MTRFFPRRKTPLARDTPRARASCLTPSARRSQVHLPPSLFLRVFKVTKNLFSLFYCVVDHHAANPIFEPEKCKAYIAYTCKMCILNNKVRACVVPACYKKHAALEKWARTPLLPQPMMTPPSLCFPSLHCFVQGCIACCCVATLLGTLLPLLFFVKQLGIF
jgi:hypothetical protein